MPNIVRVVVVCNAKLCVYDVCDDICGILNNSLKTNKTLNYLMKIIFSEISARLNRICS